MLIVAFRDVQQENGKSVNHCQANGLAVVIAQDVEKVNSRSVVLLVFCVSHDLMRSVFHQLTEGANGLYSYCAVFVLQAHQFHGLREGLRGMFHVLRLNFTESHTCFAGCFLQVRKGILQAVHEEDRVVLEVASSADVVRVRCQALDGEVVQL